MICIHCEDKVVGKDPITVQGIGIAHLGCHQIKLDEDRVFMGINLSRLSMENLSNLSDLLCAEIDIRDRD